MSALFKWAALRESAPPFAGVEIAARHIAAVRLETAGGRPAIAAHASEALPAGALVPSLTIHNVHNRATVAAVLHRVLEQIGRPARIGLVVPDAVAKVSLVRFEQVPGRNDLDQLVRWQVRKAAPFPMDEAQVSYVPSSRTSEGQEFFVTLAKRDIILEYEDICEAAGSHAGIVDLSTINVVNLVLAGPGAPAGDWLLVNVASDYTSIAILRGPGLIFFRSRAADAEETLADLVHQTAMYYEDRLEGSGFGRVLLAGASIAGAQQTADVEWIRRNLEERLSKPVETIDPRDVLPLTDHIGAAPALLDMMAPIAGLLLRDRAVPVAS